MTGFAKKYNHKKIYQTNIKSDFIEFVKISFRLQLPTLMNTMRTKFNTLKLGSSIYFLISNFVAKSFVMVAYFSKCKQKVERNLKIKVENVL